MMFWKMVGMTRLPGCQCPYFVRRGKTKSSHSQGPGGGTAGIISDEPTSNIDIASAAEIEKYIKHINQEKGTTIIMVTHNLFQARRLADEVLFLNEGHLIERGSGAALFEHPQDERTAAFLRGETVF
jgi:ABC-type dipeptide/oligopeptide/nickel transport system ATPase subunit